VASISNLPGIEDIFKVVESCPARSTTSLASEVCIRMLMVFFLHFGFARINFVRSNATLSKLQKQQASLALPRTTSALPWVKTHAPFGPGIMILSHKAQRSENSDRLGFGFALNRVLVKANLFSSTSTGLVSIKDKKTVVMWATQEEEYRQVGPRMNKRGQFFYQIY
jgi:hypothetical protein